MIGKVKLENNLPTKYWWVGQWQDGDFYGVGPATNEGARAPSRSQAGMEGAVIVRSLATAFQRMTNAIFTGLMLGGMYALIAMGLTLQYGVARIMNLSYGELLVAAAFASSGCSPDGREPAVRAGDRRSRRLRREHCSVSRPAHAAGASRAQRATHSKSTASWPHSA